MKKFFLKLLSARKSRHFDITKSRSIFIYPRSQGIGDFVLLTPLLRNLKQNMPQAKIYFLAVRQNGIILQDNPYIDFFIEHKHNKFANILTALKLRNKIDVYLEIGNSINTYSLLFLKLLNPKAAITREQRPKYGLTTKELPLYTHIVPDLLQHITEENLAFLKPFGIIPQSKETEVFSDPKNLQKAKNYFDSKKVNIIFNIAGSRRAFTKEEAAAILENLSADSSVEIYCVQPPSHSGIKEIIKQINKRNVNLLPPTKTIKDLSAYLGACDILISVDSAPVHIACAHGKKVLDLIANTPVDSIKYAAKGKDTITIMPAVQTKSNNKVNGFDMPQFLAAAHKLKALAKQDKGL